MMNKKIEKLKGFRIFLLKQIEGLTAAQLNHIPPGFNNNIIWNLGHMHAAEQLMCYVRSGLPATTDNSYLSPYLTGTRPEQFIAEGEIDRVRRQLISSLDQLQSDLDKHIFENYSPSVMIPKVYGFEVRDINDAIDYLMYHDGYHTGCILSLKHLLDETRKS